MWLTDRINSKILSGYWADDWISHGDTAKHIGERLHEFP